NDRLGQPATFAEDVARGWELADEASQQGQASSFRLQCRYALVTASLNSLAGNLPPELLEALVRQGVWPVGQALAYGRGPPRPGQKVGALTGLVALVAHPHRSSVLAEAVQAAGAIQTEGGRLRALVVLAPHLPPDLQAEALHDARSFRDAGGRVRALASLAPHLSPDLVGAGLAEGLHDARSVPDASGRGRALARE